MNPIAIFYHVYLGGGQIPCNRDNVTSIVTEQLAAVRSSKLNEVASRYVIGVSGTEEDEMMLGMMAPEARVTRHLTGVGELPTMRLMQSFCAAHPGWSILYFHTKGAIYQDHAPTTAWRNCMMDACIWNWKTCLENLVESDTCGCHWLTPKMYPIIGPVPYWAGNFFWARSDYLNTLPPINVNACRYDAEVWIGKGKYHPRVCDFAPHWPGAKCMR